MSSNLVEELDNWARSRGLPSLCCSKLLDRDYCATYVGPYYEKAKLKLLFVGLDHGWGGGPSAKTRQADVLGYRDSEQPTPWNPHYRGCIRVAAKILGLACSGGCVEKCVRRPPEECVLCHFAQGNAVKCVVPPKGQPLQDRMTFRGHDRVARCLPLLLEEIGILRPDLIVLQGSRLHWHFKKDATVGEVIRLSNFPNNVSSVVAFFRHPSRGWLERDWEPVILPALSRMRELLAT